MPSKRKRDILENFDPNKSDPEDENFEPGEDRAPRRSKKRARSAKGKSSTSRRRRNAYGGSDIEDDDLSDSDQEDSFGEEEEEDEEDEAPTNAQGRRMRKAATKQQNYKESSEDESVIEDSEGAEAVEKKPKDNKRSKIVVLKMGTRALRKTSRDVPPPTRRSTRAQTAEQDDEEFVELTNSGRHVQPSRSSASKSPETRARSSRATRGFKGLKNPPPTVEEATQEDSNHTDPDENKKEAQNDGTEDASAQQQSAGADDGDDEMADDEAPGDQPAEDVADEGDQAKAADVVEDEDDEDDGPITRRTRATRATASAAAAAAEENEEEEEKAAPSRRLTRKSRTKKSLQEPSSDFEPGEESGEAEGTASEHSPKKHDGDDNDDDDYSSPRSRSKRSNRSKGRATRNTRRAHDSGEDELLLDQNELAEELQELQPSPRPRRRRRSPSIQYEEPPTKSRRTTKPVNYTIANPNFLLEVEEEDPAPTPVRRRGRNGANTSWERNLNTTYGPFGGGGGAGSLLGGPWGTGATGGVDSDSSDDEMVHRSGVGGNVGMTPTSAAPAGLFPAMGQQVNADAVAGIGGATPNVGKVKNQKALADADPLGVDTSVDFSKVGGLQGHIDQLKEMVQLPLLYPELFLKFHVTPPRGVLFHGPPGTGKTLLARALANSVGSGGRKISFYMRKGADALSKWVGEAEKQLRLLFEEARKTQPSIIFFDEIDGLAPVRSSKQEQIHASIVSTLLALMDGMDGRGQVIVIGATNRPDNIDPALRRPGRFDREFYFPLPDVDGRRSILDIHTKDWGLSDGFKHRLAENTKGYGGADLRALCTEAALNAIQRTYPQIYSAKEKLIVDPEKISIHATDFMISIKKMIPSSERSTSSGATPLPKMIEPLLREQFKSAKEILENILPLKKKMTALEEAMYEPYEDDDHGFGRETLNQELERGRLFRPRLLIAGLPGMGHSYLSSAILHHFEGVHVQSFDISALHGDGRPLEQVIVSRFTEVKRHKPSVVLIPNIDAWFISLSEAAILTFVTMMKSIPPTEPVLLLATAECEPSELPDKLIKDLFGYSKKNRTWIDPTQEDNRREFFEATVQLIEKSPNDFPDPANRKKRVLEDLQVAPAPAPKPPSKAEVKAVLKRDHTLLNILKMQLQPIMDQINRRYRKFRQPVIQYTALHYLFDESDPNFVRADLVEGQSRPYEIVKDKDGMDGLRETATGKFFYNLETTTIEERLSNGFYARPKDFLKDIKSLAKDARNIGDKERTLKANELVSNVQVDVAMIETNTGHINWEDLYQRQVQRSKEVAEKLRKRKAMESVVGLVQSDVGGNDSDSQDRLGPVRLGEPVPGTTSARFQVMSPLSNGHESATAGRHLSNGTSAPSRLGVEDVQMGGTDEDTQPASQMGPPSQKPKGNTQISQVSAVTSVPPGVSPSAILNDASTTKTSDPSTNRSSGNWSTQATNGFHGDAPEPSHSQLPDTQPMGNASQLTASDENSWPHSQAQGIEKGLLQQRGNTTYGGTTYGGTTYGGTTYGGRPGPTSPASSPLAKVSKSHPTGMANLLNDPSPVEQSPSQSVPGIQQQLSQQPLIHQDSVRQFLDDMTEKTSGCTIEQLEQINRELLDEIWRSRGEWNRMAVLARVNNMFNDTIEDIVNMQGLAKSSQDYLYDEALAAFVHLGGSRVL